MGAEKPLIRARSDFFAGEGELEAVIRTQPWDATPLGSWDEELPLFLERRSNPEESYHTSSCSSLADDAGVIAGVLCPVTKDTERVIAGWRFACLDALSSGLAPTGTRAEVLAAIESQLRANNKDLPFTLTYLFDDDGIATLACMTDVRPRGMPDGIDAAVAIHHAAGSKEIFITGSKEPSTMSRIHLDHAWDVLFKPVSERNFQSSVSAGMPAWQLYGGTFPAEVAI